MAVTHEKLEEAQQYFNYGVKEGYFDPEEFENLTDEEFVKKVQELMDKGDLYANSYE